MKNVILLAGVGIFVLGLAILSPMFIETNDEGYYQVKQSVGGELSVKSTPGIYLQSLANITTYQISDMYYFSKSDLDGGKGEDADPIKVRFNDGGTATISGGMKFKLSLSEQSQLLLHKDFKSFNSVKHDLIRQTVVETLMQTASLMKAEDSYSTRRSEFAALAEAQTVLGIFDTVSTETEVKDVEGNTFIERKVGVILDNKGNPVIRKQSPLSRYGVTVLQFTIKDIDFDETIDNLISKKKESEQQRVVAKSAAERAKQDTITAREEGEAKIAKAKAEEMEKKIRAVTLAEQQKEVAKLTAEKDKLTQEVAAQRDLEVARLNKLAADETSKAMLIRKEAEAKANALLVTAGLTPLEKAKIDMETSVGVARELAKIVLPSVFIGGGSANGGSVDPITAIGINQLMEVTEKIKNRSGKK